MKDSLNKNKTRKPPWLNIQLKKGGVYVSHLIQDLNLHTVCEEAACPNRNECYSKKTATFLILGKNCTRHCRFCNVQKDRICLDPPDPDEPRHIVTAVGKMGLEYVVITSVTRDDLSDGGASHFARVVTALRGVFPKLGIELLIPDFLGSAAALEEVIQSGPDVVNHNVETVPRLYERVRPEADYVRSLDLLKKAKGTQLEGFKNKGPQDNQRGGGIQANQTSLESMGNIPKKNVKTKSGLMVGLGESEAEVLAVLADLREVDCDFVTIGQYLAPSKRHYPVFEYIHPKKFKHYKEKALELGFSGVASGPFVRSSYKAGDLFLNNPI